MWNLKNKPNEWIEKNRNKLTDRENKPVRRGEEEGQYRAMELRGTSYCV